MSWRAEPLAPSGRSSVEQQAGSPGRAVLRKGAIPGDRPSQASAQQYKVRGGIYHLEQEIIDCIRVRDPSAEGFFDQLLAPPVRGAKPLGGGMHSAGRFCKIDGGDSSEGLSNRPRGGPSRIAWDAAVSGHQHRRAPFRAPMRSLLIQDTGFG